MKRVFSAIELPAAVRNSVEAYSDDLAREFPEAPAKWSQSQRLHLTLHFFGNVDGPALKVIIDAYKRLAAVQSPFRLAVEGTGVFPSARRPRVLWLGISGADQMAALKSAVDEDLAATGFEHEEKDFRPHLTIARLKAGPGIRKLAGCHLSQKFEPVEFSAPRIVIFESVLKPAGPEYSPIQSADLLG